MKQYFYFFFDKKYNLCCINEYNYQYRKYKKELAMEILPIVDNINIQKIIIKDNEMRLISCNNVITFADYDKIFKRKSGKLIPNIRKKVNSSIKYRLFSQNYQPKDIILYTDDYKNKIFIKGGVITLLSTMAIVGTLSLHKAGVNLNNEQLVVKNLCYTVQKIVDVTYDSLELIDKLNNYFEEEERIRNEEIEKRNYKKFTSYNDETKYAYDNYFDIVYEEATRWGVDPNLLMAIMIAESHGKSANLMQISYSSWINHSFEAYDFIEEKNKKVVLTSDVLNTAEGNIRAACMILRHSIKGQNNNIMAGVQCYNLGDGNMETVINAASRGENMTKDELLANQDDLLFVPYTKYANCGDKHYVDHISNFLNQTDSVFYLDVDENGNIVEYNYNLNKNGKTLAK